MKNFFLDIKLKNYKKDIEANYIVLDTSNNKQNYYNSNLKRQTTKFFKWANI